MSVRYYAVQFCLRNGGWTTLPLLGGTQEHNMIRIMKKVSDLRPHFVLRVKRMTKGWEPDVLTGTEEDAIIASVETMDRASGKETFGQHYDSVVRDSIILAPDGVVSPKPEPEQRDFAAERCANRLSHNDDTRFAITDEAIVAVATNHVAHNRAMMKSFVRVAIQQGMEDALVREPGATSDWVEADKANVQKLIPKIRELLLSKHGYECVEGILYPANN